MAEQQTTATAAAEEEKVRAQARDYYGHAVQKTEDLKTSACCYTGSVRPPSHVAAAIAQVHDEVAGRYYGCGLTIPPDSLAGLTVLDLGCGAGRDVYVLSQLVGERGRVIGVDMTPEQLAVARRHVQYHTDLFCYAQPNVEFHEGLIEDMSGAVHSDSVDVVVSNCVVNLSPAKDRVLREAWRVLRRGGELYFSDVYSDRRIPQELLHDEVLHGECLSGALYYGDFVRLARAAGFGEPRLVEDHPIEIGDAAIRAKLGTRTRFWSATFRLWKLDGLEPACEDYGQAVAYKGTIPGFPECFALDSGHTFETGRVQTVCGNTHRMLHDTRLAPHFDFFGSGAVHYGIFPGCGGSASAGVPFGKSCCGSTSAPPATATGGCCGGGGKKKCSK